MGFGERVMQIGLNGCHRSKTGKRALYSFCHLLQAIPVIK